MIFTDAEAVDLKVWVIKKLEDISDADSDVLADYVLALIRADSCEPELRKSAVDNLEDFLKENTSSFVDDLFQVLHVKSYIPGYVPPPIASIPPQTSPKSAAPPVLSNGFPQPDRVGNINGSPNQSRKRSYNQRGEEEDDNNNTGITGREHKQVRRARGRGGRENGFGGRGGRGGFPPQNGTGPSAGMQFPSGFQMPQAIDHANFDPNAFGATLAAMQSMIPMLGQVGSPTQMQTQMQTSQKPKGKCHSFFEKGYCKRGNMCPYDHGSDRIVVPDQEYDPKNAVISEVQMSPSTPMSPNVVIGRPISNGSIRGAGRAGRGDRSANPPRKNRADFSSSGPNFDRSNSTIVVEQIPEERFDEQSVRDFFSDFGTITDVTMMPYKRLALVKYDDYFSAKAAYESPKVIFDNRFVKVYWYKPDALPKAPSANGQYKNASSVMQDEPAFDEDKFKRDQELAQKKLEEKKAVLKEQEEKRQALQKQKEELAARQADEKKKLMKKLAAKGQSMDLDINTQGTELPNGKEEDRKDDKASEKTKALRAQLASLEAEAKSLGLDTALSDISPTPSWAPRGRGRGRGYRGGYDPSFRGSYRGRGSFHGVAGVRGGGAYNLDNRPKKVAVSGVQWDTEKDEALRQHLLTLGDYESLSPSPEQADTQIVAFRDRVTAEKFIYSANKLSSLGEKVELAWVKAGSMPPVVKAPAGIGAGAGANDGDTQMGGAGGVAMTTNGAGDKFGDNNRGEKEMDYDVAEEDFDVAE